MRVKYRYIVFQWGINVTVLLTRGGYVANVPVGNTSWTNKTYSITFPSGSSTPVATCNGGTYFASAINNGESVGIKVVTTGAGSSCTAYFVAFGH